MRTTRRTIRIGKPKWPKVFRIPFPYLIYLHLHSSIRLFADSVDGISVDMITAQLFLFYLAGFETTAATISFTLNEISQRSNVLNRLIQDIEDALDKHQQQISYESLKDMKYLDACIMGMNWSLFLVIPPFCWYYFLFRNFTQISWFTNAKSRMHQRLSFARFKIDNTTWNTDFNTDLWHSTRFHQL